jgi:membrane protease YdiL (CAAX protease family)
VALASPLIGVFVSFAGYGAYLTAARGLAESDVPAAIEDAGFRLSAAGFLFGFLVTRWLAAKDGLSLADIGWRKPSGKDLLIGLAVTVVMTSLQHWVATPYLRTISPGLDRMMGLFSWDDAVFLIVAIVGEDTLYRGYVLTQLPKRYALPVAVAISVLAYSLLSAANGPLVMGWTVIMGVVFVALYLSRRNLWPVAMAHYGMGVLPLALTSAGL